MIKIYKIGINLREDGYQYTITAFQAEETKSAYKWVGKLIKKSLLNKIDTNYHNYGSFLSFYTWSLGEDAESNKMALLLACSERAKELAVRAEKLKVGLLKNLGQRVSENY